MNIWSVSQPLFVVDVHMYESLSHYCCSLLPIAISQVFHRDQEFWLPPWNKPQQSAVIEALDPSKIAPTLMWNTRRAFHKFTYAVDVVVCDVTILLLSSSDSLLEVTWNCGYFVRGKLQCSCSVVIEAIDQSKMALTSLSCIYSVLQHAHALNEVHMFESLSHHCCSCQPRVFNLS
jgi:hypothetical protein